ncbi:hypothetical protein LWC35_23990 [Pseudonocardia kujensis]|uniref:hypothetical protein n=1 Tax=Pseudonocardia kujensis TaxID=1128675 RepID=UPI001E2F12CB|nr:hypothetical protein [Pseudonocardia kujensis]MCE0765944.1 hypothetical protein [Pseudonocardia kujensis]
MLPGRDDSQLLCRSCAGITTDLDCHRCGAEAEHYRRRICARCALREDLTTVLVPTTPALPAAEQLLHALCAAQRPESILTWKRRPQVAALLAAIGAGTVAVSHDALDALASGPVVEHLRDLLVHHGALPHRDRDLARFRRWLDDRLAAAEPSWAARAIEQYATWHHLRAMNTQLRRGEPLRGKVHYAKQEITEIGRFMTWLQQQDLTLNTCTQQHLDRWLADGPSTRFIIRTFLRWARRHRIAPDLHVARRVPQSTPTFAEEARLELLARCLRDEPDTLTYRVAAVLLLLYAQPLTRIASMRTEQVWSTSDGLVLVLGDEPAAVPAPFDQLLLDHLARRPNLQTGSHSDSPWLFPGTRAGQHLAPNTIMTRLRSLGIDLQGARNAAIKALVQRVPPPIVASQLGYSPAIAHRHAEHAAAPDNRYAALITNPPAN